ncbi:protein translocase subunit yidC [Desulfacinum hydrothermale DSM 13146]|uniref:Membrane protein insertase YidC n=1 Tax=Desulfacinum hydrothermale DSM 13146 TaxID=1121390 RepID=A0A1W1XHV2_9BACT|nr:membrane protein insertase YidC [Desulfacinum hydrothermale]SMC23565.1 protein translocase subunit yidC [Desulfacinum hydrothermale DSM 13146]
MEKRALLAFVLSLGVVLLWEVFVAPRITPQAPVQQTAQQEPASQSPKTTAVKDGKAPFVKTEGDSKTSLEAIPQAHAQAQPVPIKVWEVDTPLYTARVASAGARLQSFQLKKHRQAVDPHSPPMDLIPAHGAGYYPLAVDFLKHPQWSLATRNFESQAPQRIAIQPNDKEALLTLTAEEPGKVRVTKVFRFAADTYTVQVDVIVENLGAQGFTDRVGISSYAVPFEAKQSRYNQMRVSVLQNGKLENLNEKKLGKETPVFKPPVQWMGYQDNYFLQAIVPLKQDHYQLVPRLVDQKLGLVQMVLLTDPFELAPGSKAVIPAQYYFGPKEMAHLKLADHNLDRALDFGWFTVIAKPLLVFLKWLNNYTQNYGIAIIILTIIIKILFWPLTHKSYKSMQVMKKIQPKMAQIREKYKDDREKLNQELMMLYRTYKVNPLGGCLPMVLQIPVFFALYRMLYGAIELRHQPFWLWINDLTAPDRLDVGFNIPYLGHGLPVLTLLMGVSMFVQQKMTPSSGDPRQEKMMLLMPVIFTVFFINFPSGLVLYWLVNNVLSIVQQYWINRTV